MFCETLTAMPTCNGDVVIVEKRDQQDFWVPVDSSTSFAFSGTNIVYTPEATEPDWAAWANPAWSTAVATAAPTPFPTPAPTAAAVDVWAELGIFTQPSSSASPYWWLQPPASSFSGLTLLTPTPAPTPVPAPAITLLPAGAKSCEDKNENCKYWESQGWCTDPLYQAGLETDCQASCGKCPVVAAAPTKTQPWW
jgi:hypothetical protein